MADDRGPLIDGVSWGLVSLSGAILGLRVYAKLSRHRGLWWDDCIALFSWFIQLVCAILISINISHGFGKHASELKLTYPQVVQMSLRGAINGSLLILGAAWSKSSFAVTLLRMTKGGLKWSMITIMATMNAFLIASIFINYFSCNPPSKTIDPMTPGVCSDESIHIAVDVAASGYSAACDLFFALVPWLVLANLQMKFKEKIGVGVAMSLGVFAAATGIVKTVKLDNLRNEDFSYNGGDLQIWSIVEIPMTLPHRGLDPRPAPLPARRHLLGGPLHIGRRERCPHRCLRQAQKPGHGEHEHPHPCAYQDEPDTAPYKSLFGPAFVPDRRGRYGRRLGDRSWRRHRREADERYERGAEEDYWRGREGARGGVEPDAELGCRVAGYEQEQE
ncbi:uncharacterized protein PG986_012607 [Apiospora aurea]|uniref:Rhodopsin domain-containing protein n=1 Tax=Apiospora aurea TaxID=335848 RepID=A0ABR1Q0X5_9PEZI